MFKATLSIYLKINKQNKISKGLIPRMEPKKEKIPMNLAVMGSSRSGKTTLMDYLLSKCGGYDPAILQKAKEGKASDSKPGDLEKVKTSPSDTEIQTLNKFETQNFVFTQSKVTGSKGSIDSLVIGKSSPDVALLMVSSFQNEFEDEFEADKQLRNHLLVACALEIKNIIVCITKMDDASVNWSEERFIKMKESLSVYLKKIGFNPENIPFIPISGSSGLNVTEKPDNLSWYSGLPLVDSLDSIKPPQRPTDKPLRYCVENSSKIPDIGIMITGSVEGGVLKQEMPVVIVPTKITTTVTSIEMGGERLDKAGYGDSVGCCIKGLNLLDVRKGYVIGDPFNDPPREAASFLAQVTVLEHPGIMNRYSPVVDCHNARVPCTFNDIKCTIDRRTGEVIEKAPKLIKTGDTCLVTMVPVKPMCVEAYSDYPAIGRFIVRDMGGIVAVGFIKSVEKREPVKETTPDTEQ